MIDHHKDKDCHWYIIEKYSYGEPPVFIAHHYGYILDEIYSVDFPTREAAESWLIDRLKRAIRVEVDSILHMATDSEYDLKLTDEQVQRFISIRKDVAIYESA
jgi:hypothetical protein